MEVQSINNSISSKGLYFTKSSTVLFNKSKNVSFVEKSFKTSKQGVRYIEDTEILQGIKDRFAQIPFIKNLAEKFDVFVFYRELPVGHKNNFGKNYFAYSRISWAEYGTKEHADLRVVKGESAVSQNCATDRMFANLNSENFSEIA